MRALKLVNPCPRSWEELQGTGSIRHCEACAASVTDLDALSPEGLEALSRSQPGGFCGRSTRFAASGAAAILLLATTGCTGDSQPELPRAAVGAERPALQGPSVPTPSPVPSEPPRMTRELCERLSALGGYISVDCDDLPSVSERH